MSSWVVKIFRPTLIISIDFCIMLTLLIKKSRGINMSDYKILARKKSRHLVITLIKSSLSH